MRRASLGVTSAALAAMRGARAVGAQCCGDCNGDGAVTVDVILTAVNRALDGCADDGTCSMEGCPAQLTTCQDELADCRAQPGGQRCPASGQTTAYGPGSDGDVQAGATLSHTDNGDGTITDHNTGLMWEKKDDSAGIHGKDNTYTWGMTDAPFSMRGTIVTTFLSTLNTPSCFASHCDWRIPNVKELQSMVDYEIPFLGPNFGLKVNAAFHNAAGCTGCTDVTQASCSCTLFFGYWASTTFRDNPFSAWYVFFGAGYTFGNDKDGSFAVRAARDGLYGWSFT